MGRGDAGVRELSLTNRPCDHTPGNKEVFHSVARYHSQFKKQDWEL